MTISEERRLVDPEEIREIQRAYFETVAAEIDRYGGTVEKYIGDAVMAIFGAPHRRPRGVARVFDAARVDLWLGEAAGEAAARERAEAVFRDLGAHPYLERAHPGAKSVHISRRAAGHDL